MKSWLVTSLDTGLPVAVGEQINAEAARYSVREHYACNLFAEEIEMGPLPRTLYTVVNPEYRNICMPWYPQLEGL